MAVEVSTNCVGGHLVLVALKVTVALNFYASGSFQAATGDMCGISQSSARHCIKVVTDTIFRQANQYIKFKTDAANQTERARDFSAIAGFPMVQGVIDCTHVTIRAPEGQSGAFINWEGFHSLNVYLVCDHRKGILQVFAHYPGSSHDAFILQDSQVPLLFNPLSACEDGYLEAMALWHSLLLEAQKHSPPSANHSCYGSPFPLTQGPLRSYVSIPLRRQLQQRLVAEQAAPGLGMSLVAVLWLPKAMRTPACCGDPEQSQDHPLTSWHSEVRVSLAEEPRSRYSHQERPDRTPRYRLLLFLCHHEAHLGLPADLRQMSTWRRAQVPRPSIALTLTHGAHLQCVGVQV
ncbi:putative nuclease HARBI1 [Heterodontus francisci]|uniref:putative nuclease HARBI1 n=1 Tax=Heterodontus francisci TaxID=7792 RepID=UPI00355C2401